MSPRDGHEEQSASAGHEAALLEIAIEAARAAADELVGRFGRQMNEVQAKSSPTDLVSEADVSAEAAIRRVLADRRPDDAILGEEGGATGEGERRWVIDPLDGTTNFLCGVPQWAVSVACEDADGGLVAVVLDPNRSELFTATRSGPPMLDGEPITASGAEDLANALVATGFAYSADLRARQAQVLTRVLPAVRDLRRAGAAALDLAWLACGRYDLYWERGVKPWDIAAGGLLARRAGLVTVALVASEDGPSGILAGPAPLVSELEALVLGGRGAPRAVD